jgi:hypothetical protein
MKQQLEAYASGKFLNSQGEEDNYCFLFYDWFCSDGALEKKSRSLFAKVKTFIKHHPEIDQEKHYIFFKNNCPMRGPLYDDFRICDIESETVTYTVTPKCGHTGLAEIWGRENDFKEAIKTAKTYKELF